MPIVARQLSAQTNIVDSISMVGVLISNIYSRSCQLERSGEMIVSLQLAQEDCKYTYCGHGVDVRV